MIMGWDGIKKQFSSVKEYAESELAYGEGLKWKLLDRSIRGNVVYSLITDGVDKLITVDLIRVCDGYWMSKSFTEKDHPYYYDCPKKFIKQSTIMDNEFAVAYKAECLKRQHLKKITKEYLSKLKMGDVVQTSFGEVVYHQPYKASQFVGRSVKENKLYRYKTSSIIIPSNA